MARPKAKLRTPKRNMHRELGMLNIGHESYASTQHIVAILNANSAPVKRLISDAEKSKTLRDATHGRRTRSVLTMDDGTIILSALNPDTIALRFNHQETLGLNHVKL